MNSWYETYSTLYIYKFQKFYKLCIDVQKNIEKYDEYECKKLIQQYLDFYKDTLSLFQKFFLFNNLHFFENRTLIPFILKCGIFNNDYTLFDLNMSLNNNNLTAKYKVQDLFQDKYVQIFVKINDFFIQRAEIEENYGIHT